MTFHIRLRIRQHIWTFPSGKSPRSWLNKCLNLCAISVDWWPRAKSLLRSFITVVSNGVLHIHTYIHIHIHNIHLNVFHGGVENNARLVFLITNEGDERGPVSGVRWIQLKEQSGRQNYNFNFSRRLSRRGSHAEELEHMIRGCVGGEGGTRMLSTYRCVLLGQVGSRALSVRAFSSTCFHIRMKLIPFGKVPIASCCRVVL